MTSAAQPKTGDGDARFIDSLRIRYEDQGFTFRAHPQPTEIPSFLAGYIPDALAHKPGQNVVIEVKSSAHSSAERKLREIRRLFIGHPDWHFRVFFTGDDWTGMPMIDPLSSAVVLKRREEVRALLEGRHPQAAFIIACSMLEAALRTSENDEDRRPRPLGTVVQTLASKGYIEPDRETRLRDLVTLRNRVVHGDLSVEPSGEDVEVVLAAVEETLTMEKL